MFPVAHAHCSLATKFAGSFFLNDVLSKNIKVENTNTMKKKKMQNNFSIWTYAEDISYVRVLNQIFESVPNLLAKQIFKRKGPYLWHCFCVYFFPFCW